MVPFSMNKGGAGTVTFEARLKRGTQIVFAGCHNRRLLKMLERGSEKFLMASAPLHDTIILSGRKTGEQARWTAGQLRAVPDGFGGGCRLVDVRFCPRAPNRRQVSSVAFGRTPVIQTPKPGVRTMRHELADYERVAIKPMLPNKPRGVPLVNDRRVLNGISWGLRSGPPQNSLLFPNIAEARMGSIISLSCRVDFGTNQT